MRFLVIGVPPARARSAGKYSRFSEGKTARRPAEQPRSGQHSSYAIRSRLCVRDKRRKSTTKQMVWMAAVAAQEIG